MSSAPKPNPRGGGSYVRDPETGALTRTEPPTKPKPKPKPKPRPIPPPPRATVRVEPIPEPPPILEGVTHRAGTLLMVSSGDYSDYRVETLVRVLHDFDIAALADEYQAGAEPRAYFAHVPRDELEPHMLDRNPSGFIAWLIANAHVEEVDHTEVHTGGDWEIDHIRREAAERRQLLAEHEAKHGGAS